LVMARLDKHLLSHVIKRLVRQIESLREIMGIALTEPREAL
jgi:hypothetical protein